MGKSQAAGWAVIAAGSVEGTLQAINSHGMLFFNIYDSIWGGRVRCDIPDVLKARALELFDQRVLVSGIVSTDAAGHPRHVKAERIDELPKRGQLVQSLKGIDPDYTSGLDSGEYLKKRWGGELPGTEPAPPPASETPQSN